jgi:DNA (cytosine-5)-methyltransferase 1
VTGNVLLPGCRERVWEPGDEYERHASGLWLPPEAADEDPAVPALDAKPLGVGLFCGAGGFDLGFTQAGFHMAAASDGWMTAACTYLLNLGGSGTLVHLVGAALPEGTKRERKWFAEHTGESVTVGEFFQVGSKAPRPEGHDLPGSGWISSQPDDVLPCEHFYLGDICALTGEQILDDLHAESDDDIAAVIGGPPCQGFSRAGQRKKDDPRNELVVEFMRLVCEIHPKAFCMENVPGMLDMVTKDGVPVIDALSLMAEEGGMGTFEAIRRSLAETAGVGAALRTKKASSRRRQPQPGVSGEGHIEVDDDQLSLMEQPA